MHGLAYLRLTSTSMFMSRSLNMDGIQISLWEVAWLTCMQNVGAWRMLGECPTRCHHIMWSLGTILGRCAMHGHWKGALKHFELIHEEGVQPNDITFVCLLSACSHAGLVDEGICYASMSAVYKIFAKSEHYTCMVDLLGHAGHLQEEENMIKKMPCQPHVAAWKALLGACRIQGNVEMAEHVARQVLELEPENAAGYVMLSNIYAAAANKHLCEDDVDREARGMKKQPGHICVELNILYYTCC